MTGMTLLGMPSAEVHIFAASRVAQGDVPTGAGAFAALLVGKKALASKSRR